MTEVSRTSADGPPLETYDEADEIIAHASTGECFVVKRALSTCEKTPDSS